MKTTKNKNITTLTELIDHKYGKRGNKKREKWEQGFEAFKLGVLLEEARLKLGMTQEELAKKSGTNKSYISKAWDRKAREPKTSRIKRLATSNAYEWAGKG